MLLWGEVCIHESIRAALACRPFLCDESDQLVKSVHIDMTDSGIAL